jgi:hypothetical protein
MDLLSTCVIRSPKARLTNPIPLRGELAPQQLDVRRQARQSGDAIRPARQDTGGLPPGSNFAKPALVVAT